MAKKQKEAASSIAEPIIPVIAATGAELLKVAVDRGYQAPPHEVATVSGIQYNTRYSKDRREAGKEWLEQVKLYIEMHEAKPEQLQMPLDLDDIEVSGTYSVPSDPGSMHPSDAGQEIIEVAKGQVKAALKVLISTKNSVIARIYKDHQAFNAKYFGGQLSTPVITFDKLDNRTLASYTYEGDPMAVDQHIRFNQNFIALNTYDRVLETLRHEMIHQWQDEVAYAKQGTQPEDYKMVSLPRLDPEKQTIIFEKALQRPRPRETHNTDFRLMAAFVGIVAEGPSCTGSPAKMPEPQSYNRKFRCACVASNSYPLTIYSTREVNATCNVCGKPFVEVGKESKGKTVSAKFSHVERPGQDAVQEKMRERYEYFTKFQTKKDKDQYVKDLYAGKVAATKPSKLEQGVYQKGHNAYTAGERYWVAFTLRKPRTPKAAPTPEAPVVEGTKRAPRKNKAKVLEFPSGGAVQEKPVTINPKEVIELYKELGTIANVAERLGMPKKTLITLVAKHKIDFNAGTFEA